MRDAELEAAALRLARRATERVESGDFTGAVEDLERAGVLLDGAELPAARALVLYAEGIVQRLLPGREHRAVLRLCQATIEALSAGDEDLELACRRKTLQLATEAGDTVRAEAERAQIEAMEAVRSPSG